MVAFGRALSADAGWINKIKNHRKDEIKPFTKSALVFCHRKIKDGWPQFVEIGQYSGQMMKAIGIAKIWRITF
jgi:hypothetical protein